MSRFSTIPAEITTNPRISGTAHKVYAALAMCRNSRTGHCNPSHAILREMLHITENPLAQALRRLELEGEIIRHYEAGRQTWYEMARLEAEPSAPPENGGTTPPENRGGVPLKTGGIQRLPPLYSPLVCLNRLKNR